MACQLWTMIGDKKIKISEFLFSCFIKKKRIICSTTKRKDRLIFIYVRMIFFYKEKKRNVQQLFFALRFFHTFCFQSN